MEIKPCRNPEHKHWDAHTEDGFFVSTNHQAPPAPEKCGCMLTSAISCSGRASEPCRCKCHPLNQPADAGRCGGGIILGQNDVLKCLCDCHDSEKAVEAKIKALVITWGSAYDLETHLRKLVELARK